MSFSVIPETEVVKSWNKQMASQRKMVTADGRFVEIVYPGKLNDARGGDFRDAVILLDGVLKKGNIEIHSCLSGWKAHEHHLDSHYNRVVLHVVWQQDCGSRTFLENGQIVPTIVLDRELSAMEESGKPLLCQKSSDTDLGNILEALGVARITRNIERLSPVLKITEAEQILYTLLLEALGYSKNKEPFLNLARCLPLNDLKIIAKNSRDRIRLQSILLGSSGLLPSQRSLKLSDNIYVRELEQVWKESGYVQLMSSCDWEFYKVRPANNPVSRIIALSNIVFRYRRYDWINLWLKALKKAVKTAEGTKLGALLIVRADGYWLGRHDFGSSAALSNTWLLGKSRSNEIIINVILPYFRVWAKNKGEESLAGSLDNLIRHYPPCGTNSILDHMIGQLAVRKGLLNSSVRQQGLLHLYKAYCTQGRCFECVLTH